MSSRAFETAAYGKGFLMGVRIAFGLGQAIIAGDDFERLRMARVKALGV